MGDEPCINFEAPCPICAFFTEDQMQKIAQRKWYLDLLGDDFESFTGNNADLESAADNLFTSLPRPQPLPFSSLSLETPAKTVPPTPGTTLQ